MYYPVDRHEQNTILSDLSLYGAHGPHLRYRQERLRAMLAESHATSSDPATSRTTLRARIGGHLIAWGKRLEGCTSPTVAHPA